MDEAVLIDLIQHYPHLYDKSQADYKNNLVKDNSWRAISSAMGQTVEDCLRMWRNLRERYARERRRRATTASGSAQDENEWPLYGMMSFMAKHIATRKRIANVQLPTLARKKTVISDTQKSGNSFQVLSPSLLSPVLSPENAPSPSYRPWSSVSTIIHNSEIEESQAEEESQVGGNDGESIQDLPDQQHNLVAEAEETDQTQVETAQLQVGPTPRRRRNMPADTQRPVVETLNALTSFLQNRKSNSNALFGNYVGGALTEMPMREANYKKRKIIEILTEQFVDE